MLHLYSFDSGYSSVVLGEWGGGGRDGIMREIQILQFFSPNIAFYFFYYQKMYLLSSFIISKILVYIFNFFWQTLEIQLKKVVTQIVLHYWHFWQHISMKIFSGKRYFNEILWSPAYNNNTLPDTGISSNKI